ncbi:MAG: sodium:proton antiporter [Clostridiales Family XIII bacterium]|jgi:CPA1 family monovalent cation:H+ antiporter|nr:sodium:proton antiporter [Clostridiales Family XIII bacterium]
MELTTFIIILLAAIVLSNILDSAFPSLPVPIIQIGLGVVIALTPLDTKMNFQPEIFMGVLIAPLLYRESEEADFFALWKVRKEVVFMVFGLVFATVFVIGFSLSYFVPVIPLAACFCLGGILGPTDAIAVSTISKRVDIEPKIMNILKGEFLINDASGVIAFNFAALALTTGAFSFGQASLTFLFVCFGGVAIGLIIEALKGVFIRALKREQIKNAAAFMIIEILMPFICFFAAEAVGVSGVLAAVTAGCRQALLIRKVDIFEARFAVIKKSLWDMISVVFNSFIFILLGLQLPIIVMAVRDDPSYTIGFAMKIGLLVTGVLFAVRYIGVMIAARELPGEGAKGIARNRLVLTLSGVKGTVSLATAFALPLTIAGGIVFKERDLLLLITGCAIIYSLLLATVLLPLVAKPHKAERKNEGRISVLRDVIERVELAGGDCSGAVVMRLKRRLLELELEDYGAREMRRYRRIRNEFFETEMQIMERKVKDGEYTKEDFVAYSVVYTLLGEIQNDSMLLRYRNRLVSLFRSLGLMHPKAHADGAEQAHRAVGVNRVQEIFWENTGAVIAILDEKLDGLDEHLLSRVVEERIDAAGSVVGRAFGDGLVHSLNLEYNRELKLSYDIERAVLAEYVQSNRIDEREADEIRVEINTLETFTIEEMQDSVSAKLIISGAKRRQRVIRNRLGHVVEDDREQ